MYPAPFCYTIMKNRICLVRQKNDLTNANMCIIIKKTTIENKKMVFGGLL